MGLIDKNEILHELRTGKSCEECERYAEYGDPKSKCKGHLNWACRKIQNMKSVKAIPIEFIKRFATFSPPIPTYIDGEESIDMDAWCEELFEDWEAENEDV